VKPLEPSSLPYRQARESVEEKHVCPLQLDVIDRCLVLWSNPGDTVLSPFMGVGSEVYQAVVHGRKAIGAELKATYYRQACGNLRSAKPNSADSLPVVNDAGTEDYSPEQTEDAMEAAL